MQIKKKGKKLINDLTQASWIGSDIEYVRYSQNHNSVVMKLVTGEKIFFSPKVFTQDQQIKVKLMGREIA